MSASLPRRTNRSMRSRMAAGSREALVSVARHLAASAPSGTRDDASGGGDRLLAPAERDQRHAPAL